MDPNANSSVGRTDRACEHCAAFFIARRSDQRFCSDRCRLRHWRLQKSATDAATEERSSSAAHTQAIRKILLRLSKASSSSTAAEQLREAFAELAELDQAIFRLQRRLDRAQAIDLTVSAPPEDRETRC
jgi:hypothetical protein